MHAHASTFEGIGGWLSQFNKHASFIITADLGTETGVYYVAPYDISIRICSAAYCSVSHGPLLLIYRPINRPADWRDGKCLLVDCRSRESTNLSIRVRGASPVWAEDAQRFAFAGYTSEKDNRCVAVFDATTKKVQVLFQGDVPLLNWSQDGDLMALVRSSDRDDIALVQLYPETKDSCVIPLGIDLEKSCWGFELSPHVSHLCYFRYPHGVLAGSQRILPDIEMCILNVNDRSISTINCVDSAMRPLWSQDGNYLFYAGYDENGQSRIKVYSLPSQATVGSFFVNQADDTGEVPLSRPFWLDDSRHVGFLDYELEGDNITVVDVQTLQVHRLNTKVRISSISTISCHGVTSKATTNKATRR